MQSCGKGIFSLSIALQNYTYIIAVTQKIQCKSISICSCKSKKKNNLKDEHNQILLVISTARTIYFQYESQM